MDQINVGAGVIIWKEDKVLLGKRLSAHGTDHWSFPGGHVEFGETPEAAAVREVREETNLVVAKVEKFHFTNDMFDSGKQYITLFYVAAEWTGELKNMEPEKCEGWEWVSPEELPEPLFQPIKTLLTEVVLKLRGARPQ